MLKHLIKLVKSLVPDFTLWEEGSFTDAAGESFDCAINDRAWWDYCNRFITERRYTQKLVLGLLQRTISQSERIYLRLGLARPLPHGDTNELRCYLHITGVYVFPSDPMGMPHVKPYVKQLSKPRPQAIEIL